MEVGLFRFDRRKNIFWSKGLGVHNFSDPLGQARDSRTLPDHSHHDNLASASHKVKIVKMVKSHSRLNYSKTLHYEHFL